MNSEWPSEPWRRRTVLVLGDADVDLLRYEGGGSVLVKDEVHIVRFPSDDNHVAASRLGAGLCRGAVFIQSPYDEERYEPVEGSMRSFAREKCTYASRVCQLLGARKIRFEETAERVEEARNSTSKRATVKVDAGHTGVGASGQHSSEWEEGMIEEIKLQMESEFAGGEPDVSSAEELLREKKLMGDVDLRNLIELRRYARNPLKRIAIKLVFVEATSHTKKVLDSIDVTALSTVASTSLGGSIESEDQWTKLLSRELKFRIEF